MLNVRLVGFRLTDGPLATPVPLKVMFCGLPAALSAIDTLALREPAAVGVNVTLIVQDAPAANVLEPVGQVLVCAKSPAFVPVSPMLLMLSPALPLFVSVMLWGLLLVPTFWLLNVRLVGFRLTAGALPWIGPL